MNTSAPETTLTVGYFNAQRCPVHVVVSEFNVNLRLEPGGYVEDTLGRKINDAYFDRYKVLSKEVGTVPVPLIRLAKAGTAEALPDGHAVRQVTDFKLDSQGRRVPVMPAPQVAPPRSLNANTVQVMTMEQARAQGLVGRVRVLPEDYGVPDTTGVPPAHIPEIKYAQEAPSKLGRSTPPPVVDEGARTPLQAKLEEAARSEPELTRPIDKLPASVVTRLPAAEAAPAAAPEPATDDAAADPGETSTDSLPEPALDDVPAKPAPIPLPPRQKFICAADGRRFDYRSQLEVHVKRKYPGMYDELMKPYPKDAGAKES